MYKSNAIGECRNRTGDLVHAEHALCQLSWFPCLSGYHNNTTCQNLLYTTTLSGSNYSLPTHYYYIYTIETHQPYQTQITIKPFNSTRISYYIYSIYHNIYLKTKDKNYKLIVTTRPAWDWYMAHNLFKCIPFSN